MQGGIHEEIVLQRVFRVRVCRLEKIQEFFLECFQHFLQRFNSFVNYTHRLTGINPLNDTAYFPPSYFFQLNFPRNTLRPVARGEVSVSVGAIGWKRCNYGIEF